MDSALYNALLACHLLAVITLFSGIVLAGVSFEVARRRTRTADIVALLSLARVGILLVAIGALAIPIFGLWMVHVGHWGYGSGWVEWSIGVYVLALTLGGLGGRRPRQARELAGRLAEKDLPITDELWRLLNDRVSLTVSYGSLIALAGIVVLMVFK